MFFLERKEINMVGAGAGHILFNYLFVRSSCPQSSNKLFWPSAGKEPVWRRIIGI
jgi:hypothetical protein